MDPLAGRTIGGVALEARLGQGGMAAVYVGRDQEAGGQRRAVKVLAATSPDYLLARFGREARIGHALRHPLLVGVHRYGVSGDYHYLVMDLVEGEDLSHVLDRAAPLQWPQAAVIGRDVARALAALHAQGVIHRDLKPQNVLLDGQGRIRVADFGLASWREGPPEPSGVSLTATGDAFGTPVYMAPEQFDDAKQAGAPADLYALGVILFEALAGRTPFSASTPHQLSRLHKEVRPPSLEALAADAPDALRALVDRLLEKDPAARPGSAEEVADALAALAERGKAAPIALEPPPGTRTAVWDPGQDWDGTPLPEGRRGRSGRTLVLGFLGVVLLLLVAAAWQTSWVRLQAASPEERARFSDVEAALERVAEDPTAVVAALESYRRDCPAGLMAPFVEKLWRLPVPVRENLYLVPRAGPDLLVHIPAGRYQVGLPDGDDQNLVKRRSVRLSGFLIDRREVSNRRYERFLAEWRQAGATHRCGAEVDHGRPLTDRRTSPDPEGPVVGTSPYDALEFALFYGRRLPTEAEWEVAASWSPKDAKPRIYPWGGTPPDGRDNRFLANLSFADLGQMDGEGRFLSQCAPSGYFELDESGFGVLDMGGNAAEWCAGAQPLPGRQPLRGGSIAIADANACLAAARAELDPTAAPPREAGFRTVLPYEGAVAR